MKMSTVWRKPVTGTQAWRGIDPGTHGPWQKPLSADRQREIGRALAPAKASGDLPHRRRYTLRLWLRFPELWPTGPDCAAQKGYVLAECDRARIEA
jgi:hypothetical protein